MSDFLYTALPASNILMILRTVTVYACSSSGTAISSGVASATIASTGVVTAPTSTGSPIAYATGAASMNGVSGLAAAIAGGVALVCCHVSHHRCNRQLTYCAASVNTQLPLLSFDSVMIATAMAI